jgi:hypothetical protein
MCCKPVVVYTSHMLISVLFVYSMRKALTLAHSVRVTLVYAGSVWWRKYSSKK